MENSPPPAHAWHVPERMPKPITPPAHPGRPLPRAPHFIAVFFFSFFLGVFGADRFYVRRYPSAILKLLTFGGFGIWALVDLALVMAGAFPDKYERPMLQFEEYKQFAKRTVLWVTLAIAAFLLINGIFLVIGVMDAVQQFQQGGGSSQIQSLLGGGSGGSSNSSINSLLGE